MNEYYFFKLHMLNIMNKCRRPELVDALFFLFTLYERDKNPMTLKTLLSLYSFAIHTGFIDRPFRETMKTNPEFGDGKPYRYQEFDDPNDKDKDFKKIFLEQFNESTNE